MTELERKIQYLVDLEEIKKLKYLYCRYNDGGWTGQPLSHQGPSHELFTEDGVWDGSPMVVARGRDQIRKLFDEFAKLPLAYHAVMNPIIEIDGDVARGHWHLIGGGLGLDGGAILGISTYEDEYVRTPDGWRIKLMRVVWGRTTILPASWIEETRKLLEE
jgi:hypothetical protein